MFVYSKSYMKRFQKSCAIMTSYSLLLILVHIFHFDIFRQIEFWCIVTKIIISSFTSFWWRIICEKWRYSPLYTLYSWDQNWKKKCCNKFQKLMWCLFQIELEYVHHFWAFYTHYNPNSAQWRIELFSNFGSILIDLKDKPTTEEIYTWKFFYNITTLWCLFFVVLARDSNFFSSFQKWEYHCIKKVKMKIASAFWVNNFVKWNINFPCELPNLQFVALICLLRLFL